jgi:hypothetical protein
MKWSKKEAEFIDTNESLICFDPSVYNNSVPCLLIKRQPFLEFLKSNNLRIIWTMIGEKQIYGSFDKNAKHNRLEIEGLYFLDNDGVLKGDMLTENT